MNSNDYDFLELIIDKQRHQIDDLKEVVCPDMTDPYWLIVHNTGNKIVTTVPVTLIYRCKEVKT